MTTSPRLDESPDELVRRADEAEAAGRYVEAVDLLQRANRLRPDADVEVRLVGLRDRGFDTLTAAEGRASWPPAYPDLTPGCEGLPEIDASELSEATLGSGIVNHGALVVRNLLEADQVTRMVADIDRAFAAYDEWMGDDAREADLAPWFARYRPANGYPESKLPRNYVRGSGGVWVADTPRMMFELVELFERKGLDHVIADYLGERPALSVKKCTLRRVPIDCGTGWHQDGAFMGDDIRTVNVWIALTDCGGPDSDAPALDVVPRRFDDIVETGTEGAPFDTFVGVPVVERLAGDRGILRPVFRAGDALLFDDLFLHSTGMSPSMSRERYAIESWFFAPSTFPPDQVPLLF
ncbi:MAG: phytanoyl-CoA dioxygenase family protein [Acidimicrobiales bacterium]